MILHRVQGPKLAPKSSGDNQVEICPTYNSSHVTRQSKFFVYVALIADNDLQEEQKDNEEQQNMKSTCVVDSYLQQLSHLLFLINSHT